MKLFETGSAVEVDEAERKKGWELKRVRGKETGSLRDVMRDAALLASRDPQQ